MLIFLFLSVMLEADQTVEFNDCSDDSCWKDWQSRIKLFNTVLRVPIPLHYFSKGIWRYILISLNPQIWVIYISSRACSNVQNKRFFKLIVTARSHIFWLVDSYFFLYSHTGMKSTFVNITSIYSTNVCLICIFIFPLWSESTDHLGLFEAKIFTKLF